MRLLSKDQCIRLIPLLLITFWGTWFAIAALTNLLDLAFKLGWLDPFWRYRSMNFDLMASLFSRFDWSTTWVYPLLIVGIFSEMMIASLFFITAFHSYSGRKSETTFYPAFLFSLVFWCAFLILDEALLAYSLEGTHLRILIAQVLSLMLIRSL